MMRLKLVILIMQGVWNQIMTGKLTFIKRVSCSYSSSYVTDSPGDFGYIKSVREGLKLSAPYRYCGWEPTEKNCLGIRPQIDEFNKWVHAGTKELSSYS